MELTKNEKKLINILTKRDGWLNIKVERKSNREYDLKIKGEDILTLFEAWLPLSTIRSVDWPKYANMSSYPEMVSQGDWSGIRDSDTGNIWLMLTHALTELIPEIDTRSITG